MTGQNSGIPEGVIVRLFARMEAIWGERFHRFWAHTDLAEVRKVWREGLNDMNDVAFRHGLAGLIHEPGPPDLPRFRSMCRREPMHVTPVLPSLTHQHCVTPEGQEALAKLHAMLAPLAKRSELQAGMTGIEWAFRILHEADDKLVPLNKLTIAQQAIDLWCTTHHCSRDDLDEHGKWRAGSRAASYAEHEEIDLPRAVPSPHIYSEEPAGPAHLREPGEDDE